MTWVGQLQKKIFKKFCCDSTLDPIDQVHLRCSFCRHRLKCLKSFCKALSSKTSAEPISKINGQFAYKKSLTAANSDPDGSLTIPVSALRSLNSSARTISWHYTSEPVDEGSLNNQFDFKHFRMMSREFTLNLSRLKRLKIASLTGLRSIRSAAVRGVLSERLLSTRTPRAAQSIAHESLRRPNLRILRIGSCQRELSVNSPKLRTLSRRAKWASIGHPRATEDQSILRRRFPNIEIFKSSSPYLVNGRRVLDDLPKLKEFHPVVVERPKTQF